MGTAKRFHNKPFLGVLLCNPFGVEVPTAFVTQGALRDPGADE